MGSSCQSAVLFDLDGVLVDSRAAITGCIDHALREHGLASPSPESLLRFIGPPLALAFAELTQSPPESPLVASCVAAYRDRYATASLRDTTVVPGVHMALEGLAQRFRLAVATSKPRAFAEPLLDALGLGPFFAAVAGPDLSVHGEGKAQTIASALSALGMPERAVMVGDRSFDVAGAHAHALPAIGVTWGIGSREELELSGADAVIDKPAELIDAAELLFGDARDARRRREARGAGAEDVRPPPRAS